MKIQCNVCDAAEAIVLCCSDEAALCWGCDQKVHAANKLASKHQRIPLSSSSSQMPRCDICQETVGYFFCLEDRAVLCRKCDVAIHTANSLVSVHQRFLLTGIKVGLEATEPGLSSSPSGEVQSQTKENILEPEPHPLPRKTASVSPTGQYNRSFPAQTSVTGEFISSKLPFNGSSPTGSISQWPLDDYLRLGDFNLMDYNSSKAHNGKLAGDCNCSPTFRIADADLEGDDCLGEVPDTFWAVPEIPSLPTASGLGMPKDCHNPSYSAVFARDVSLSLMQSFHYHHHHHHHASSHLSKKQRHC